MPALIPALIVGAAGVASAAISSNAASHASDVANQAASANNMLQQQTFESNKALIQPAVDRGNAAADELKGFLGLGGDPEKAAAALNTYLNSTDYRFTRDQGLDAVGQAKEAEGLYNSGAAEKALTGYGANLASAFGQQYASDLSGVATAGQSAVNALVSASVNNSNQQQANTLTAARVSVDSGLNSSNNLNALIVQGLNAYGMTRGRSSFGDGSYNAFAPGG